MTTAKFVIRLTIQRFAVHRCTISLTNIYKKRPLSELYWKTGKTQGISRRLERYLSFLKCVTWPILVLFLQTYRLAICLKATKKKIFLHNLRVYSLAYLISKRRLKPFMSKLTYKITLNWITYIKNCWLIVATILKGLKIGGSSNGFCNVLSD